MHLGEVGEGDPVAGSWIGPVLQQQPRDGKVGAARHGQVVVKVNIRTQLQKPLHVFDVVAPYLVNKGFATRIHIGPRHLDQVLINV